MKRLLILLAAGMLLLSLAGCKKNPAAPTQPTGPEEKDYIDFHEEAEEMDIAGAQSYLQDETADVTTPEYRQAVYTVNQAKVSSVIDEAHALKQKTQAVTEVFDGIAFRFHEGETFASATVKKQLAKKGTYAWDEETGYYRFTLRDRTLAQAAVNLDDDHALEEYTAVLDLLLSDPNVIVKALL